jgi:hypothetical protein
MRTHPSRHEISCFALHSAGGFKRPMRFPIAARTNEIRFPAKGDALAMERLL